MQTKLDAAFKPLGCQPRLSQQGGTQKRATCQCQYSAGKIATHNWPPIAYIELTAQVERGTPVKRQQRRKQRFRRERPPLRSLVAQPAAAFYHLPEFELRGGYLLTDGCRRVLDFSPEAICLDMGNFTVTFYGSGLRIESFAGKRLVMAGRFSRIEFRNKWERSVP
ncbi:YabP/YqfC family sporulation protein [uncultured Subdoligranulum sp.]|uniref:YabP/YqfC family sporulation protein n=1 Tax=uncultured Subdoligranulum sp. TaxID=512298 RepID=UPI00260863F8|nr:YabP/YqfC family sporulation protein [uncultured Subdoligranulum sp.]